jgi:hypothetical protein
MTNAASKEDSKFSGKPDKGLTFGYPGRYYTVLRNTGVIPAIFGAKIESVVGKNFSPKQV